MRYTVQCPGECADEEHEVEIEPEGRGFHGGWDAGDVLPCGHVVTAKEEDAFTEDMCRRLSEPPDWD